MRLPHGVLQRMAGKAQVNAPEAAPWVVLLGAPHGAGEPPPLVLDASTGRMLSEDEARKLHPGAQLDVTVWQERAVLLGWRELVRTVIQAHTRRGESELTAHWMRVLLALDTQAAEWRHVLHAEQL